MDGTLVDSEPLHKKSIQVIGNEIGLPVSDDLANRAIGVGHRHCFDMIEKELGEMPISFDIWFERVVAAYLKLTSEITPRHSAVEIVKALHAKGIRQAIFSNSPRNIVEANATGFLRFFDHPKDIFAQVISLDDVSRPKPEPDGYILAAERLGIFPDQCLVIEDSPTGVNAGKAAGCFTIYWPEFQNRPLQLQPDMVTDNLAALFI
jgi:HAD superfamily hydrolase (TIGR01509 family)